MANTYLDQKAQQIIQQVRETTGVADLSASQAIKWLAQKAHLTPKHR